MSKATPRAMSLYTATCLVVANMIGTGVFTSVGFQIQAGLTPFVIILLWMVGGLCAFCGSIAYAELAAALPRSGGEYHFLARIFHPALGFLAGWATIIAGFAAPVAVASIAAGKYIHGVWPVLPAGTFAAIALAGITSAIVGSPRIREWFQDGATSLKVVLVLGFITLGAFAPATGSSLAPRPGDGAQLLGANFASSLVFVMYAYSGWNASAYVAGEVHNPGRTVPLSMAIGTVIVTAIYVAVNAVFLRVAPAAELSGQVEVGLIVGKYAFGETGGRWTAVLIALGLLSSIGAMQWIGPRVLATMGEDHRTLRPFTAVSKGGLPIVATIAQTGIVVLLLTTGTFESVLTYVGFTIALCSFLTVLGLFVLRWREPLLPRPVRAWGYPLTPLIFLTVNGWMLWHVFQSNRQQSIAGLVTMLVGLIVFQFSERRKEG
jgi:basic amino acid/polyamine antiporter, APA family